MEWINVKEFDKEFKEYWKLVSEDKVFECDLEREYFYVKSKHEFIFGGVRQNMKRTKMIDRMLDGQTSL